MKILFVDDEPQYRLMMNTFLHEEGWEVYLAEDGDAALAKLQRVPVDVIISDVYMPVMDGVKLHRAVREMPQYQRLPFIFISGYDDEHTRGAVKNPKLETFVRKADVLHELKKWVLYLSTPEEDRPPVPPTRHPGGGSSPRRPSSGGGTSPTL